MELRKAVRAGTRMGEAEGKITDELKQRIAHFRDAVVKRLGSKKTPDRRDQLIAEASRLIDQRRPEKLNSGMTKQRQYNKRRAEVTYRTDVTADRIGKLVYR